MLGLRPTLGMRGGGPGVASTGILNWLIGHQTSAMSKVVLDFSARGHHGYYADLRRAFVGDDRTGPRVCHFPGTSGNTLTVQDLSPSTLYDLVVLYHDDTTASFTASSNGSGDLTVGTEAELSGKRVKWIGVYLSGGPLVESVDLAGVPQGTRNFSALTRPVSIAEAGSSTAEPTPDYAAGTLRFDGTDDFLRGPVTVPSTWVLAARLRG